METRSVSEEERRFLADASGYGDPLLAFCATFRSRPQDGVGGTPIQQELRAGSGPGTE
jgi:hypothetical protein